MEHLQPFGLDESHRPALLSKDELVLVVQDDVAVYDGPAKQPTHEDGVLYVTSHRILWLDKNAQAKVTLAAHLSSVDAVEKQKGVLKSSPKIWVYLSQAGAPVPAAGSAGAAGAVAGAALAQDLRTKNYVRFSFRGGGQATVFERLKKALADRAWLKLSETEKKEQERKVFKSSGAGVAGILRNVEQQQKATDKSLTEAFSDLNSLMDRAKEMVTLAERISANDEKQSKEEDAEFRNYLLQLGISSPITRETAGNRYLEELAAQLATFLRRPLEDRGGLLALTDVYCMFNRARGTQLVSPDDLYKACTMFESLRLNMRLHRVESGALVIQSVQKSEDVAGQNIAELARTKGPLTAVDAAKLLSIPLALANQQLIEAEGLGLLCRDEGPDAVSFYQNFFLGL